MRASGPLSADVDDPRIQGEVSVGNHRSPMVTLWGTRGIRTDVARLVKENPGVEASAPNLVC